MKTEPRPSPETAEITPPRGEDTEATPLPAPAGPPAAPGRRFQAPVALRHRDFALLWGGQAVSQLGTQMQIVGTAWLLWNLTHSALALGLVGLARAVPLIAFALFGGVVADALDRRRLLLATQTILMALSAIMALVTGAGLVSPWMIYAFIVGAAIANAFDNPARSALIPNLVPRTDLPNALSLNNINFQIGTVVGPTVAGFILAAFDNATAVYWADGISYLAVLRALLGMHTRLPPVAGRQVSLRAALDGLQFVRRTPIMASTMTLDFFATLFGVSTVLMPVFADRVLHVNADGLGLLYAADAVGAVITSVILSFLRPVHRQGAVVLAAVAVYGLALALFGLSHLFWLSLLALALAGAADTVSMVMRQTIRQLVTPDEMRGRMTSVNMIFFMGGPQFGNLEAGALAQAIGAGQAVALGGLGVLAVVALTAARVPALRGYRG